MKLLGSSPDEIIDVGNDTELDELRDEVRQLKRDLQNARAETQIAKRDAARAMTELRRQLSPLYKALQMVFGELDSVSADDTPTASSPKTSAVWEAWKSRIGGQPAKVIDALLLHGDLNAGQIAIAIGISPKNVAQVIHKLNKASLIEKNNGRFSLKSL